MNLISYELFDSGQVLVSLYSLFTCKIVLMIILFTLEALWCGWDFIDIHFFKKIIMMEVAFLVVQYVCERISNKEDNETL